MPLYSILKIKQLIIELTHNAAHNVNTRQTLNGNLMVSPVLVVNELNNDITINLKYIPTSR